MFKSLPVIGSLYLKAFTVFARLYSPSARTEALNITTTQPGIPFAPSPLPPPGSSFQFEDIISQFTDLGRSTKWNLVEKVKFEGDTFEPEGIVRVGHDRYIVSAGEYTERTVKYDKPIDGTDRTAGAGFGHMIVFDGKGARIADATITKAGSIEYHNGGLDYDGTYIWATLSQYRPNTTATLVRIPPDTLQPEPILHMTDHMGGVVHDLSTGDLLTLNWGSRNASRWSLDKKEATSRPLFVSSKVVKNPSHYTDYQDCKYLGHSRFYNYQPVMLCSGITGIYDTTIGGVALVDMETMLPLYEVPLTMLSDLGTLVTKNPMDVAIVNGKMRLYFLPDERNSTLYVFETAS